MPPDARSVCGLPGPMLAWAKTTMAKPIAAAANAKPIFRLMANPSSSNFNLNAKAQCPTCVQPHHSRNQGRTITDYRAPRERGATRPLTIIPHLVQTIRWHNERTCTSSASQSPFMVALWLQFMEPQ